MMLRSICALFLLASPAAAQQLPQIRSGSVLCNPNASQSPATDCTATQYFNRAFGVVNRGILATGATGIPVITPTPTIGVNGATGGQITFAGSTSGTVALRVPAAAGTSTIFQLPGANGTSGQVLTTDGTGITSWAAVVGTGTVQTITAGTGITLSSGATCTTNCTISLTAPVTLALGGTNANLTASNGGILYSTASAGAILAATATAGQHLQSGASSAPSWTTATFPGTASGTGTILRADGTNWAATTATYPATTTVNQLLYSSSANVIAGLATTATGAVVTSSGGVPSLASGTTANRLLRTDGTTISFSQVAAPTDISGLLPLSNGGTNNNLVAAAGGIFYSTSTAGSISAGTATASQMLQSGASTTPTWSTATWPATTTINRILFSSASNVVGEIATANGGLLNGGATGVPAMTVTPVLGVAGTSTGKIGFSGVTSGVVTVQPASIAGTWTLTLPTTDGNSGEFLQTDGSGITSWASVSGSGTVTTITAGAGIALSSGATCTITCTVSIANPMQLGTNGGTGGSVKLFGATSGDGTISVAAAAGTATAFQIPATNGTAAQFLQTNGSGVTSWQPVTVVNGVTYPSSYTAGAIPYANSTSTITSSPCTIDANADLTCASSSSSAPVWAITNSANDGSAAGVYFQKSRSGAAVQNGDGLGNFAFQGFANGSFQNTAEIQPSVDAAPSGANIPSKITFYNSNASGQFNQTLVFDSLSHLGNTASVTPTISSCGTTPGAATGNDLSGKVVVGTSATGCTINFGTAYRSGTQPRCNANMSTAVAVGVSSISTTAVAFVFSSVSGTTLYWFCFGT